MEGKRLIGICGVARSGKDTLAEIILNHKGGGKILSIADALKRDLDPLLKKRIGHSAFSEDPAIKKIIRPLLVCYGTEVIRHFNDNCWLDLTIDYVDKHPSENICIPDIRFANEVNAVHDRGGIIIHVSRYEQTSLGYGMSFFYRPANEDEATNDPIIKEMADYHLVWENFKNDQIPSFQNIFPDIITHDRSPINQTSQKNTVLSSI